MRILLMATCLLLATGCGKSGPATYQVTGTATFDGTPIDAGHIKFVPDNPEQRAEGGFIKGGKFSFEATAGKKRVEITAQRNDPVQKNPKGEPVPVDYIPTKYNTQSTLTAEVKDAGANEFNFPLESR